MPTRIPGLDGIRGLAVLLVMANHLVPKAPGSRALSAVSRFFASGWIGVEVFFVLSGFLITEVLLREKDSPGFFVNFYARRCLRIWPLYFVVVGAVLTVASLTGRAFSGIQTFGLTTFTANIVMVASHDWVYLKGPINVNHLWSLAIEEQFYLLWPFAVFFLPLEKLKRFAVGLALLSVCARLFVIMDPTREFTAYMLTPCRFDAIALGCLCAVARRDGTATVVRPLLRASALAASGLLLTILVAEGGLLSTRWPMLTIGMPCVSVLTMSAILQLTDLTNRGPVLGALENATLRWFGKYSYGLYVLHVLVMGVMEYEHVLDVLTVVMPRAAAYVLYAAIGFAVSVLAARLSWACIETPFLRLKDRLHGRRNAPALAQPA